MCNLFLSAVLTVSVFLSSDGKETENQRLQLFPSVLLIYLQTKRMPLKQY